MNIRKTRRHRRRKHKGVAAVEFAFAAPALFVVIFVCAEFARISMMRNLAQCAAYEVARSSIVEGATQEEALAKAATILSRLGTKGATVDVNGGEEITAATNQVVVLVEIPLEQNSFFYPAAYVNKVVRGECTLNTERYKGFYAGD